MTHHTTAGFWRCYDRLPQHIQALADKQFELLKTNPYYPSLHFKKVGRVWSARVNDDFRALGLMKDGALYWFWIGTHGEYDRILSGK